MPSGFFVSKFGAGTKTIREIKSWGKQLDGNMSVDLINEPFTTAYYQKVFSTNLSVARKRKFVIFFRMFINWLFMEGVINAPPRNLKKKLAWNTLETEQHDIATFENVKEVINSLPPNKKAWALLALNCGMNNCDLGILQNYKTKGCLAYIEGKYLIRKRHKLAKRSKAPYVKYKLWQETIDAINAVKGNGLLVFTTKAGLPMYRIAEKYDLDLFSDYWQKVGAKPAMSLKDFRTHGATVIETHPTLARYATRYLANVPIGTTEIYYAGKSEELFFEVLEYLREKTIG